MEHSGPESFVLTFVPLFIVIDALGILPVVVSLGEPLSRRERRKMVHVATLTAGVVGLAFLFFGRFILNVLDISVGSFAIAGGIVLLALSINYMLTGRIAETVREEMVAVVPIGTPLLAGPATITTLLLLGTQFPMYIVLLAFLANVLLAWIIFMIGDRLARLMGQGGLKAVSKVFNLILAAIAVAMVIKGLDLLGIISVQTGI
jgi:multiple antibiotic resistance protein